MAFASALCFLGPSNVTAEDPSPSASDLERLLAGTKRVETIAQIPAPFTTAIRREYDASTDPQMETPFEPYLANRYFWTMERVALKSGTYALPLPGTASTQPMCADGALDAPLDPTVWDGAWTGWSIANIANSALPIATWTPGLTPNDNSIPDQTCNHPTTGAFDHASQAHHSIVPAGWDPEFPNLLRTVAPAPVGNPASLRLGNRCTKYGGERVSKTFPVVAGQTTLQFWYAMVFQNPVGHPPGAQPGFGAYLYDGSTAIPNRIDLDAASAGLQDFVYADASNPFFGSKGTPDNLVVFSAWTCVTVDLSGLEGQTLTLILVNRDCGYGAHWGYTYVDSLCLGCAGNATGDVIFNAAKSDCVGGQLCFDYTVPVSSSGATGQVDLSLGLYQNGAVLTTLASGPLTSDGTYCFTLPMSSLDATLGGYDWSATANFTLAPATIAPLMIGNAPNGQAATPGQNDDCLFTKPAEVCPGTLCVYKFDDRNEDGKQQLDEPGVHSFVFLVTGSAGGATLTTNASGVACTNLPPGTYTVEEQAQGGWTATTPTTQSVTVTAGQITDVMFGNRREGGTGRLCVHKFLDVDGDGRQDQGEPPLGGWTFDVTDASGNAVGKVTTDKEGNVCIELPAGTYTVAERSQAGYTGTTPTTQTATVTAGETTHVIFGNRRGGAEGRTGKLCVLKFLDVNRNGRQDPGEVSLAGWTFEVRDAQGGGVAKITTDKSGVICTELPAGTYTVTEQPQAGYTATTPTTQTVTVTAGQTTNVVFGNRKGGPEGRTGKLCVLKFLDENGNGRQDKGEVPLAEWTFEVRDARGRGVAKVTTERTGVICTELPAGTYTVTEQPQAGYTATTPTTQTVTVTAGQTTNVIFGNRKGGPEGRTGRLCVHKFLDANGNGRQDREEGQLAGWTFEVRDARGRGLTKVTTDKEGNFCTDLPAGTYLVVEQPQAGYTATTPMTQTATVTAGQTTNVIFGNRKGEAEGRTGKLCVLKFLDENGNGRQDKGEVPLAGWTFEVRDARGRGLAKVTTDKSGVICTDLPAGTYAVVEQPQAGYTATTPMTQSVTVTAGQTTNVIFGNRKGGKEDGPRPPR